MAFNCKDIPEDLRELKRKEFLEQKRRQRLRENSQELREIEKHLRSAYNKQQLNLQKQEIETRKKQEQRQKEQESIEIETLRKHNEELQKQKEIENQKKKDEFRSSLKNQILDSFSLRQKHIEEMAQERDHVDRLLQRLKIEQQNEMKELEERKLSVKHELEVFMRQQEERKLKERELDEADRKLAEEIQRKRDEEKKRLADMRKSQRKQQEIWSEKIGLDLHRKEMEKRHRENLMLELLENERKAREDYCFKQNLERQIQKERQAREELERYIESRRIEREIQKRNKMKLERAEIDRIISENERITAEEVKKMREKVETYKRLIQEMLEERRKQRSLDISNHLRDFEQLKIEEKKIEQEIEDERIRLLGDHPAEILRNLPAGILRESDREFFALPPQKR